MPEVDDPWLQVRHEALFGEWARLEGQFSDAAHHLARAVETAASKGFDQTEAFQRANLGRAQCDAEDHESAAETLALAAASGVKFSGVLCGRATWKDGIPVYAKQGPAAFRRWLESEGVENIRNVNAALKAATSWFPIYGVHA